MGTVPDGLENALAANARGWRDADVRQVFEQLRLDRDFRTLARLADKAARFAPDASTLRRLQAQALIECGELTAAVRVIEWARGHAVDDEAGSRELDGLLGRAYKQMFLEAGDCREPSHRALLDKAIAAYRRRHEDAPEEYWHGVNLLALQARLAADGSTDAAVLDTLARNVLAAARRHADADGDPWAWATLVEVHLFLDDIPAAEQALYELLREGGGASPFHVGSLLRQLVQVWRLDRGDQPRRGLLEALRAAHAKMPGTDPTLLDSRSFQPQGSDADELRVQFERILGSRGLVTYDWWRQALQRATCIAAVRDASDRRIGTAFLVEGGSLVPKWAGHRLALTNFHVVNRAGAGIGLAPEDATLVFEAVDPDARHGIREVLWESPQHEFDCAVLLLDGTFDPSCATPFARSLPVLGGKDPTCVYIIGHPQGRGLEFSIADNQLLAHDAVAGRRVTRVHYLAPTEEGSSGSPVFRQGKWEALAIHHGYSPTPLDGHAGKYDAANEGIGLQSIRTMLASIEADLPDIPAP